MGTKVREKTQRRSRRQKTKEKAGPSELGMTPTSKENSKANSKNSGEGAPFIQVPQSRDVSKRLRAAANRTLSAKTKARALSAKTKPAPLLDRQRHVGGMDQ
jgi:hypothetical protein